MAQVVNLITAKLRRLQGKVGGVQSCRKATGMQVSPVRKVCKMGSSEEGFTSTQYMCPLNTSKTKINK